MGKREIAKNTLVFAGSTLASRVLGFIRDILIASFFGAGPITDAFFVAFRIPNLFRRLLGEGALSSSFMPVFAKHEEREGVKPVLDSAFASLLPILTLLLIAGETLTPQIVRLIAPGFSKDPGIFKLTVELTKITFPYIFFMGMAILVGAALNYAGDFFYTSFSPCLLNASIIASVLLFAGHMEQPVFCLAWGVFAGGVLQIAFHFLGAKRYNLLPNPLSRPFTPPVREALALMLPATAGLAIHQVNTLVDTIIASFLPKGSVSYLYYANRLFQLPLALFGIAIGTVLLPYAARYVAQGRHEEVLENTRFSVSFALLITVPAAAGLALYAFPIIDLLFRRGRFTEAASHSTAAALAMYALGLPLVSAAKPVISLFYAHRDMKTPVKAAGIALFVNAAGNLLLMGPMKHTGLALATSIASLAQLLYLLLKLKKLYPLRSLAPQRLPAKAASLTVLVASILVLKNLIPYHNHDPMTLRALKVFAVILASGTAYIIATLGFKIEEMLVVAEIIRSKWLDKLKNKA